MSQFLNRRAPFSFFFFTSHYLFRLSLRAVGFALQWALCSVIECDGLVQMETLYSEG